MVTCNCGLVGTFALDEFPEAICGQYFGTPVSELSALTL